MAEWLIAVPAWGARCVDLATRIAIPSMVAALRQTTSGARFIVYTDRADAFEGVFGDYEYECRRIAGDSKTVEFGTCHAKVLAEAVPGTFVALLNADQIVSRETFTAAEVRFASGTRVMVCGGIRTLGIDVPPSGASAEEVYAYSVANPHQGALANVWPLGRAATPSVMYLRDGGNHALHGFHLHPYALVARSGLTFRKTIDRDLLNAFTEDETHVVTDYGMALAEISPADKRYPVREEPNTVGSIARWAERNTNPRHWWLFKHRIVMAGNGDAFDYAPIDRILRQINASLS